jgi:hypothetical protein
MPIAPSTKERIGKMLQWTGAAGFFLCFAAVFVMSDLYMQEPRVPKAATLNDIQWGYHGAVYYITPVEDWWWRADQMALLAMFCLIAIGIYLAPEKIEKWPKKFPPRY